MGRSVQECRKRLRLSRMLNTVQLVGRERPKPMVRTIDPIPNGFWLTTDACIRWGKSPHPPFVKGGRGGISLPTKA